MSSPTRLGYVPGPIWPPDWSQFVPDAIGAIATGAVIGLVLWRIEATAGASRERREAESSWRVARALLASSMTSRNLYGPGYSAIKYKQRWKPFLGSLDPRVAVWADQAPRNHELQLARALLTDLPLLQMKTRDFVRLLHYAVVKSDRDWMGSSETAANYILARIIRNPEEAEGRESGEWKAATSELSSVYDAVTADPIIQRQSAEFIALKTRVEAAWVALRASLRAS